MRRLALVLLALGLITACDSGGTPGGITVAFVGNSTCSTSGQSPYSPSPPDTNSAPVGHAIAEMPHYHVVEGTVVNYMHNPPTSGCHYSLGYGTAPIATGIYPPTASNLAKLKPEYWVHNLEHGYVVVSYNCPTGCDSELQQLSAWYKTLPPDPGGAVAYPKFIAVPDPQQQETWDIESWDWFDPIGSTLNLAEVQKFYANHINQAPEGANTP